MRLPYLLLLALQLPAASIQQQFATYNWSFHSNTPPTELWAIVHTSADQVGTPVSLVLRSETQQHVVNGILAAAELQAAGKTTHSAAFSASVAGFFGDTFSVTASVPSGNVYAGYKSSNLQMGAIPIGGIQVISTPEPGIWVLLASGFIAVSQLHRLRLYRT